MSSNERFDPDHSSIFSSVIQRSLVPDGLNAVLSIASVPVKELGVNTERQEDPDLLIELSAEILGIPKQSFLDETQYRKLKRSIENGDFWSSIYRHYPGPPYFYDYYRYLAERVSRQAQQREKPETDF